MKGVSVFAILKNKMPFVVERDIDGGDTNYVFSVISEGIKIIQFIAHGFTYENTRELLEKNSTVLCNDEPVHLDYHAKSSLLMITIAKYDDGKGGSLRVAHKITYKQLVAAIESIEEFRKK